MIQLSNPGLLAFIADCPTTPPKTPYATPVRLNPTDHHACQLQVAEAYLSLIATAVEEVRTPVEALLEVAAYPDYAICAMSFNFW